MLGHLPLLLLVLAALSRASLPSSDAIPASLSSPSSSYSTTTALFNGTLTAKQINQLATQSAQMVSDPALKMFKSVFAEFAPEPWVEALEDIPITTIRCLVRESTIIALEMQQELVRKAKETATKTARDQGEDLDDEYNEDYYGGSDNSTFSNKKVMGLNGTYSQEQICAILQSKCRRGFQQILALNKVINETMEQLPEHVLQILQEYSIRFKGLTISTKINQTLAKSTMTEFFTALTTITVEERQKLGDLFPKLRAFITDPRIDQLLNMMIACSSANASSCNSVALNKLLSDIWKSAKTNSTTTTLLANKIATTVATILQIPRNKRDSKVEPEKALDMPDVDNETDDGDEMQQGIVVYSSNNEPLDLVQMDGPAPPQQAAGLGVLNQP